jgi:hypothetical protein
VALGDSYSSGTGTGEYARDEACRRSDYAYPVLLARREGARLVFRACSGATTSDIEVEQLGPKRRATRVTITAGGNDAGFSSVLEACARPWPWTCDEEMADARRFIRRRLPGRLDRLFGRVRSSFRRALVLVVGYPRLFNEAGECDGAQISPEEQVQLNGLADLLTRTQRERALRREQFDFVDVRAAFDGHRVCDAHPWINGLSWPVGESYHPNRAGQRAYAREIRTVLP